MTGIDAKIITFPGGEPHVTLPPFAFRANYEFVTARIRSFNDLGKLLVLTDAIRRSDVDIELTIPYFPGARQDRVANPGEALTVKVYTDIINAQGYQSVTIADPHSDVTPALLNNVRVTTLQNILGGIGFDFVLLDDTTIIIPDAGASKRITSTDRFRNYPHVQCTKHRDTVTGKLSEFVVHANSLKGRHCLIVDDICDGGRTFIGLAQKLREKGAEKVSLYVTHGIFSHGLIDLFLHLDHIITTNSFRERYDFSDSRFHVINHFDKDVINPI